MSFGQRPFVPLAGVMLLSAAWVGILHAQSGTNGPATRPAANAPATTQPAQPPSSGQVMEQLLQQRETDGPTERDTGSDPLSGNRPGGPPAGASGGGASQPPVEIPDAGVSADQSVLGIAPGDDKNQPDLRREGSFLVTRRGHLARAKDSNRLMFLFAADKQATPERPMFLQACRTLESMERIVEKRGESVEFIVSGQVHSYHGKNYLMPTMMKIAPHRDNLSQ